MILGFCYERGCRYLLLKYLPDFCWQTAEEVLWMIEVADPSIEEKNVSVALAKMAKLGEAERRLSAAEAKRGKTWRPVYEYRRVGG